MNTSLFSNMFKSLFGEQITPTAQQFVPITGSDGTPAGISSMAGLMSLLGDQYHFKLLKENVSVGAGQSINISDFNQGIYFIIDGNMHCTYIVVKVTNFKDVVSSLNASDANSYTFSINNGTLVATNNSPNATGYLTCWAFYR